MEKADPVDMARARAFDAEVKALRASADAKAVEFQAFIDALFAKHNMVKGRDQFEVDGTIARGKGK